MDARQFRASATKKAEGTRAFHMQHRCVLCRRVAGSSKCWLDTLLGKEKRVLTKHGLSSLACCHCTSPTSLHVDFDLAILAIPPGARSQSSLGLEMKIWLPDPLPGHHAINALTPALDPRR